MQASVAASLMSPMARGSAPSASQMHVSRLLRRALAQLRDSVGDVDQLTDAD